MLPNNQGALKMNAAHAYARMSDLALSGHRREARELAEALKVYLSLGGAIPRGFTRIGFVSGVNVVLADTVSAVVGN